MSIDHERPTHSLSTVRVEMAVEASTREGLPAPLPRCCRHHANWTALAGHLVTAFPRLDEATVCEEVERARAAVKRFGLHGTEGMDTAEAVARNQMMLLTGQRIDNSRLRPETLSQRRPRNS
jgi:hypothetical protein